MQAENNPMVVALRVLTAIAVQFNAPLPADTKVLRSFAQNDAEKSMALDELARLVIQRQRGSLAIHCTNPDQITQATPRSRACAA